MVKMKELGMAHLTAVLALRLALHSDNLKVWRSVLAMVPTKDWYWGQQMDVMTGLLRVCLWAWRLVQL